ncbi:hypothetical protein JIN85_08195 [Luteolibacter pohnpeiensis]|uniref:Uncharacterized protein n=1 Tax=Luteolibacter pohnpeiensis TaxID=454153 RepID=A0A934S7T6_9BACT|nr:hypothetical protein [Luteolibacter pohnpeiensis]MBK1882391.1 hypothetical protein [Luteolibacter pohnpeiensis]
MKKHHHFLLLGLLSLCISTAASQAEEEHDHSHDEGHEHHHDDHEHAEHQAGPNGGKIIETADFSYEFFVTSDKKVKITFLDQNGATVAPTVQVVQAVGGDRLAPTRLVFKKDGNALLSDQSIPEGHEVPMIVMVKSTPDAKAQIEKFNINLATCPTCEYPEYACICGH